MKKFLCILGGTLLIMAGAWSGFHAYAQGGGMNGWNGFSLQRLIARKDVIFAIACPLVLLLGVGLANFGSRLHFALGALLAFAATGAGMMAVSHRALEQALPWLIAGVVLAIAAAATSSLGRKTSS